METFQNKFRLRWNLLRQKFDLELAIKIWVWWISCVIYAENSFYSVRCCLIQALYIGVKIENFDLASISFN